MTRAATPVNLGNIRLTPAYSHKIDGTYLNDGDTGKGSPVNDVTVLEDGEKDFMMTLLKSRC